jgi:hypothetical protein
VSEEEAEAPLIAFSRDAAEQLWREQHLVGQGSSSNGSRGAQQEVTALALDLMLLATMCSGNDYLPAVQGMQLSNKHRPGLWDLFTAMRQEPQWRGQTLVLRSCECGGPGSSSSQGGASMDCPTVSINAEMLGALLGEYYRQRVVHFEQPPGEGEGAAAAGPASGGSSSIQGAGEGSVLGSMDGGGSGRSSSRGGDGLIWGEEGLAAAAALAAASGSDAEGAEGAGRRGSNGGKKKGNITLRGMEAHPESYIQVGGWMGSGSCRLLASTLAVHEGFPPVLPHIGCPSCCSHRCFALFTAPAATIAPSLQGLEWVLQMYCSGAVRDYRFMYDLAAPSLLRLLETVQQQAGQQQQGGQVPAQQHQQHQQREEGQQHDQQDSTALLPGAPAQRSLQPLLPATCAMALLPRGGRMHAGEQPACPPGPCHLLLVTPKPAATTAWRLTLHVSAHPPLSPLPACLPAL